MKTRKIFKITGIILFILSLTASFFVLTLSEYTLTDKVIQQEGKSIKFQAFQEVAEPMIGKTYKWNFNFIHALGDYFDKTNDKLQQSYSLDPFLLNDIVKRSGSDNNFIYSTDIISDVIPGNSSSAQYKRKKLNEYTQWMDGKKYNNTSGLIKDLSGNIQKINRNIINDIGFRSYETGQYKFNLTKHASHGLLVEKSWLWLLLTIGMMIIGGVMYGVSTYGWRIPGIKNDHIYHNNLTSRGWIGIVLGIFLILFYIIIYFYPEYITNWVILVDPISRFLNGGEASHWFLYGVLYTLAILIMSVRMMLKYKGNRYQMIRTVSVTFFQLSFAFLIPEIMVSLNNPYYDFKNIWPLDYDFFYGSNINSLIASGSFGWFILFWGIGLVMLAVPFFSYFFGKRWYCSWVCGCGGLAETMGDPFRHLSDKTLKAWQIERWLIHGILLFVVINTAAVLYTFFSGHSTLLGIPTDAIRSTYGFVIGSIFAGVIGVGFYPFMGSRVWCRFGCPLAAYIGLFQRFKSRFRITTNGGQCISCGNCSTYCEMGIDVRWYAQRGQNIIRSSCVGCGICASVCPRGVLKLENKEEKGRFNGPELVGNENFVKE